MSSWSRPREPLGRRGATSRGSASIPRGSPSANGATSPICPHRAWPRQRPCPANASSSSTDGFAAFAPEVDGPASPMAVDLLLGDGHPRFLNNPIASVFWSSASTCGGVWGDCGKRPRTPLWPSGIDPRTTGGTRSWRRFRPSRENTKAPANSISCDLARHAMLPSRIAWPRCVCCGRIQTPPWQASMDSRPASWPKTFPGRPSNPRRWCTRPGSG